jgi:hypothetical protein
LNEYQAGLRRRILQVEPSDLLPEWGQPAYPPVGGLYEVGFGRDDRFLLAVSSDGRGVFDCRSGEKIARDRRYDAENWSNASLLECQGIGPLENETIRIAGRYGGGLPRTTDDNWAVECVELPWPEQHIIVVPPNSSIFEPDTEIFRLLSPATMINAYGFSPSGRTFVVATSSELTLYWRDRD